jgi:hypothetical protein
MGLPRDLSAPGRRAQAVAAHGRAAPAGAVDGPIVKRDERWHNEKQWRPACATA